MILNIYNLAGEKVRVMVFPEVVAREATTSSGTAAGRTVRR